MRAGDYLQEIVWSFRKQRLRTALTASGIGIGAFAIAIMVSLGSGLQSFIEAQIHAFGNPRVLYVYPKIEWGEQVLDRLSNLGKPARPVREESLKEKDVQRGGAWITVQQVRALRCVDGVEKVAPASWAECDGIRLVGGPSEDYEVDFVGLGSHPLIGDPSAGRFPRDDALDEVILAPQYAESWKLKPRDLVGREVELRCPKGSGGRFVARDPTEYRREHRVFRARVVGLAERSLASRAAYVPTALGREILGYQTGTKDLFTDEKFGFQGVVRVAASADPVVVKQRIQDLQTVELAWRRNAGLGPFPIPRLRILKAPLSVRSVDDQLSEVKRAFLAIDAFLTSFGLVALLVATLGIVNTLLMAISERTREIGVMKALGATEATIRRMFAIEAAAIGFVGGVGGALVATAIGAAGNILLPRTSWFPDLSGFADFQVFLFPPWLLAGAIGFSTVVGALAGLYPANRAARLDPVEALRYE